MQLRMPSARCSALIAMPIVFVIAFTLNATELHATESTTPSSTEPAPPLAAALCVRFVDGSSSSLILERDGKEYVVENQR